MRQRTVTGAACGAWMAVVVAGLTGCATDPTAKYFTGTPTRANVIVAPVPSHIAKVAVMPFRAETELIGTAGSDAFVTELMRAARYDLVERSQMSKVLSESELALAGLSAAKAAEVGKMLGADGVVIGTVDEYSMVAHRGGTYPAVGISARLIDCASGKVMWSVDLARRAEKDSTTLAEHGRQVIHEMVSALYRNWGVQRPAAAGTRGVRMGSMPPAGSTPAGRPPMGEGASVSAHPAPPAPTAAPSMRLGDMGLRETKISWEPVGPEVRKIRIERGETAAGPFVEIATVSASSRAFADKGTGSKPLKDGAAYYYRIVPLGSGGVPGAPGSVKESMTAPPPDPPPVVKAEATAPRTIALTWSPSPAEGVTKYVVERAPADRPDRFAVRGEPAGASFVDGQDADLADGATYLYRVSAINRVGARGAPSVLARATTPPPPPPVAGLTARSGEFRRASLQWTSSPDPFVARYEVFRSVAVAGPFAKIGAAVGRTVSQYVDGGPGTPPLGDGVRMFYRVRAIHNSGGESPDSPVVVAITKSPPARLGGLEATTNVPGRIEIAWEPPQEKDIVRFRVEASASPSGPFVELSRGAFSNRCAHVEAGLAAGNFRVYRVRAVDMDGLESPASDPVAGVARPLPPHPASVDIAYFSGGAVVTWAPFDGMAAYRVYRRDGEQWARLAETPSNTVTLAFADLPRDTAVGISCVDREGLESAGKALVQAPEPPPPVPAGVAASADGLREVAVRWAVPKDNARRVRIERSPAPGGPFSSVGEADAAAGKFADLGGPRPMLEDATEYFYRVLALNQSGRASEPSAVVKGVTAPPPAPPTGLRAEAPASRALAVAWEPSPAAGVVGAIVERAPKTDPASFLEVGRVTGTSFREGGTAASQLGDSVVWLYRVTSTNRVGSVGPPSETVEIATLPRPATVRGLAAKSAEVRCVPLTWEASSEKDVVRYDIYRAPAKDGEYAKVASVQGRSTISWLDGKADPGDLPDSTPYFYRVRAVNAVTSESEDGEPVAATTRDPPPVVEKLEAKSGAPREVPLSWTASPDEKVTGYIVQRAAGDGPEFAEIGRVQGRDINRFADRGASRGSGGLGSLSDGASFRYRVVAVNTAKALSPPSAEAAATTKPAPAAPADAEATTDLARSVRVRWKPNPEPDIATYVIESATEAAGRFREQTRAASTAEGMLSWIDEGEPDGVERFYRIKAVDRDTLESPWCPVIKGATRPLPDAPKGLKFEWTGAAATVVWAPPLQTNIANYKVYQKGFFGSKNLATVATASYNMPAADVGKRATLVVTAVDVDGLESPRSQEIEVCPPAPAGR